MDALQTEILKILAEEGQMHSGDITNKLKGQPAGWDVSDREVQAELNSLLKTGNVQRQGNRWQIIKKHRTDDGPGREL